MKHFPKKKSFCAVLSCFLFIVGTSAQSLQWVKMGGGAAFDFGEGICSDPSGNVYVTGEYEFKSDFSGTWITCAGLHDIFVAKYNASGILQWLRSAGGIGGDGGHAITTDIDGNVYITGEFEQSTAFGSDTITGLGLLNDIFVAKYDSSGVLQWVRKAGGWLADKGRGISTDANKNVYTIGEFKGTAYFDTIALVSSGDKDAFLSKYSATGDLKWVRKIGGSGMDDGKAISTDLSGNSYVTGYFSDTAYFGIGDTLISSGGLDVYIAKYDSLGNLLWAKKAGGLYYDIGKGIVVDNLGMLYVTGEFRYKANFDSLSVSSNGKADVFIACYDSSGNARWVRNAGGGTDDMGNAISIDSLSNIYITGQYGSISTFGTAIVAGTDSADMFLASYDFSGNFRWVQTAGSDTLDYGNGVCVDNNGNAYVAGGFGHTAFFSNDSVKSSGHTEFFIAKYAESLTVEPDTASFNLICSSPACKSTRVSWTTGNGNKHLVIAKMDTMVDVFPLDGRSYSGDPVFGRGSNLGNKNYVVYNDTGSMVEVSGLSPWKSYYFAVFEYNGAGVNSNYYTAYYPIAITTTDSLNLAVSFADTAVCSGTSIALLATGATTYKWSPAVDLNNPDVADPVAFPKNSSTYTVTGVSNSCMDSAIVKIVVNPIPIMGTKDSVFVCFGDSVLLTVNGATEYNWSPTNGLSDFSIATPIASPAVTTTYTITGIANSCFDTATTTVIVNNLPQLFLGTDTLICANSSLTLSAGDGFVNYNWSNGSHAPTIKLDSTGVGLASRMYYLLVSDTNACSASDSVRITFAICDNVYEQRQGIPNISVYPNPTGGVFCLQSDNIGKGMLTVKIYDMLERIVYKEEMNVKGDDFTKVFDLQDFVNGIYLIRIENAEGYFSIRILIQK